MSKQRFPVGTKVRTYNGYDAEVVARQRGEALLKQEQTGLSLGWWKILDIEKENQP